MRPRTFGASPPCAPVWACVARLSPASPSDASPGSCAPAGLSGGAVGLDADGGQGGVGRDQRQDAAVVLAPDRVIPAGLDLATTFLASPPFRASTEEPTR